MATDPNARDNAADSRSGTQMFTGWRHVKRALGVSLYQSVKRSRKVADAQLRRKGG